MVATENVLITVNGLAITQAQLEEELENHSADNPAEAGHAARRALVVRELLLQEALRRGFGGKEGAQNQSEEVIDKLLAAEIEVAAPDEASCKRYFEAHRLSFATAPIYEASHILFPAQPGDRDCRESARSKALDALRRIKADPACFDAIASSESACPSAARGGRLGVVAKGQTLPAFEAALKRMKVGEISSSPVETEVGFHIIRLDERHEGEGLPYEVLKDWIAQHLRELVRHQAMNEYVMRLARQADIQGFVFDELGPD